MVFSEIVTYHTMGSESIFIESIGLIINKNIVANQNRCIHINNNNMKCLNLSCSDFVLSYESIYKS